MRKIHADRLQGSITIGREGETDVTAVVFDDSIALWQAEHGPGTVSLLVQRQGDPAPYPVALEVSGAEALWTVRDQDTAIPGYAKCQLSYSVDGRLAKSRKYVLFIEDSLGSAGPLPPPYQDFGDKVAQDAAKAQEAAQRAEAAVTHGPQIQPLSPEGTWHLWDREAQQYKDTHVKASGGGTVISYGDGLKVTDTPEGLVLSVDTVDRVEDNTRPITAAAVYTQVGNIEALLASI